LKGRPAPQGVGEDRLNSRAGFGAKWDPRKACRPQKRPISRFRTAGFLLKKPGIPGALCRGGFLTWLARPRCAPEVSPGFEVSVAHRAMANVRGAGKRKGRRAARSPGRTERSDGRPDALKLLRADRDRRRCSGQPMTRPPAARPGFDPRPEHSEVFVIGRFQHAGTCSQRAKGLPKDRRGDPAGDVSNRRSISQAGVRAWQKTPPALASGWTLGRPNFPASENVRCFTSPGREILCTASSRALQDAGLRPLRSRKAFCRRAIDVPL